MRAVLPLIGILAVLGCAWWILQPDVTPLNGVPASAAERGMDQERARAQAEPPSVLQPELTEGNLDPATSSREAIGLAHQGLAAISVLIRDATSKQPLMNVVVRAQAGDQHQQGVSDAEGRVILQLPPEPSWRISAGGRGESASILSPAGLIDDLEYKEASQRVEGLSAGESRELTFTLSVALPQFWFRIVDGETGEPLQGVKAFPPMPGVSESDAEGIVIVEASDQYWGEVQVRFEHPSYGPTRRPTSEGGESRASATRVELHAPAQLRLTVVRHGVPLPHTRVTMEYAAHDGQPDLQARPVWGGKPQLSTFWGQADENGVLFYDHLPARQPLVFGLAASFGSAFAQTYPELLVLAPGELRELTWEVGQPQDLSGRVIDQNGAPIAGTVVWLLRENVQFGIQATELEVPPHAESHRLELVSTQDDGTFRFEQVNPGRYWVAMARDGEQQGIPMMVRVTVPPNREPGFVEIQARTGEMLRGVCVDDQGNPVSGVELFAIDSVGRAPRAFTTDAEGHFEVGPYESGAEVNFMILFERDGWRIAEPTVAQVGLTSEVILRVTQGSGLSGRVLDADGKPVSCDVYLTQPGVGGWRSTSTGEDGKFSWRGLAPGDYRLLSSKSGGWFGSSETVHVRAGESVQGVALRLERGAELIIENGSGQTSGISLQHQGAYFGTTSFEPGVRQTFSAPRGLVRVRAYRVGESEAWLDQVVDLSASEVHELVLQESP